MVVKQPELWEKRGGIIMSVDGIMMRNISIGRSSDRKQISIDVIFNKKKPD